MGVSQSESNFGGLYNKDYSIWGFILGSTYFGKVPGRVSGREMRGLRAPD